MKKNIFLVLLVVFLARLLFYFDYHALWWDSSVYIGMSKFIYSFGKLGLWEPIRPIFWPIILGGSVLVGRIFGVMLSLGIVYLTFLIGKKIYNERVGIIASILVGFSAIFFFFGFRLYTEIPALFFILLSIYFALNKRYLFSGLFVGLGFLTKFPAGIFLICLLPLIIEGGKGRNLLKYVLGFGIPVGGYLIFNQVMYGNFLFPFISASAVIGKVSGCNFLRYNERYNYFIWMLKDNYLNLFGLFGLCFGLKKFDKRKLSILLCLLLPLIYFLQLGCREYRYVILFLPFISIFVGVGLYEILNKKVGIKIKNFWIVFVIVLIVSGGFAISYYNEEENTRRIMAYENFVSFLDGKEVSGEVWITNPAVQVSKRVNLLYYPVYDVELIDSFMENLESVEYIFLDSCNGGMICRDELCETRTTEMIFELKEDYNKVYDESFGRCDHIIFQRK